jgi:predicted nucleic acid-binding protein
MATMRARNLDTIFAFDADFARAGFQVLPTA